MSSARGPRPVTQPRPNAVILVEQAMAVQINIVVDWALEAYDHLGGDWPALLAGYYVGLIVRGKGGVA